MTPLPAGSPESPTAGAGQPELDITILVPCLNEAERIGPTLRTIQAAFAQLSLTHEIIVVDDGSTDGTAEVVRGLCRAHPDWPVTLVLNPRNLGLSRTFVDTAFRGRGRYYRLVCGDNVEPMESIVKLLRALGQADLIIPYYPVLPGKSRLRKFISAAYTRIVNVLSGRKLRYYNGCALYRRFDVMRWASYNYGFGFQAHLITTLLGEGATYVEVPLAGFHLTKERGSPVNLRNLMSTGHTLFEILCRRVRHDLYGN